MTDKTKEISRGKNFTAANIGELSKLSKNEAGKVFVKDIINSTSTEISFSVLPAKTEVPFFHTHKQNEEIYIFLHGDGEFQVDDTVFPVSEGSIVRVATEGQRNIYNSSDKELSYIVIQAKENSLQQYSMGDGIILEREAKWKK